MCYNSIAAISKGEDEDEEEEEEVKACQVCLLARLKRRKASREWKLQTGVLLLHGGQARVRRLVDSSRVKRERESDDSIKRRIYIASRPSKLELS